MRDARVLHAIEQERGLGAVEDAALGDDAPIGEHVPLALQGIHRRTGCSPLIVAARRFVT
jgi:hypothetical protein